MPNYLYEDLTYSIRHCIFDIQNELGTGFDEETYHQALARKFKQEGIPFISKAKTSLKHRDILIREFILDFLIDDKVILSLKCLPCDFLQTNYVQLFTELKLWKKRLGLMANFGLPRIKIDRIVFDERKAYIDENYDHVRERLTPIERNVLKELRDAVLFVVSQYGVGFGQPIVKKLVEAELNHRGIRFEKGKVIPIEYMGETIRQYKMREIIIDDRVVLMVRALQDKITHNDISRSKSYLKALRLSAGIVVNFGKSELQISAVHNTSVV